MLKMPPKLLKGEHGTRMKIRGNYQSTLIVRDDLRDLVPFV